MVNDIDKLISDIREELDFIDNSFMKPNYLGLLTACKKLLVHFNYRVYIPLQGKYSVNNEKELVQFFYQLLWRHKPELENSYINEVRDRVTAKRFVKSRLKDGVSKQSILNECAEIINIVITHEDEFNFTIPLNFNIFGQEKFKWIVDKAVAIINRKKEKEHEDFIDKILMEEVNRLKSVGWNDLEEILDRNKIRGD